jgi:dihydrofolate synthase/folylpolyglutamate synthase
MVPEEFVIRFTEKVQALIEKIEPSFFEITVAMAFDFFAAQKVDIAIIETGLGGRLDSTNIIIPELSIITNISYDHMNILGNSLEEIAGEKAGIIKENIPVIIGEKRKESEPVFISKATEKHAPVLFAEDELHAKNIELDLEFLKISVRDNQNKKIIDLKLDLPGIYQAKNILTVLSAIKILKQKGWNITEEVILTSLQNVKKLTGLHGRWEVIRTNPTVVLEVAHNEAGIKQLLEHVQQLNYDNLHLILGLVKDKEQTKVLELLPASATYYFTQAHIPRALDKNLLQEQAEKFGLKGETYEDVDLALKHALNHSSENDLIIICGSIFLVAEVTH